MQFVLRSSKSVATSSMTSFFSNASSFRSSFSVQEELRRKERMISRRANRQAVSSPLVLLFLVVGHSPGDHHHFGNSSSLSNPGGKRRFNGQPIAPQKAKVSAFSSLSGSENNPTHKRENETIFLHSLNSLSWPTLETIWRNLDNQASTFTTTPTYTENNWTFTCFHIIIIT